MGTGAGRVKASPEEQERRRRRRRNSSGCVSGEGRDGLRSASCREGREKGRSGNVNSSHLYEGRLSISKRDPGRLLHPPPTLFAEMKSSERAKERRAAHLFLLQLWVSS